VPPDISSYQTAWILDQSEALDGHSPHDDESTGTYMTVDDIEGVLLSEQFENLDDEAQALSDPENLERHDDLDVEIDSDSETVRFSEEIEANTMGESNDHSIRMRRREEEEDLEFPDEVALPKGMAARVRFQKYRGLQSFRHSSWDTFENLPTEYSRISQFQNFSRSRRRALICNQGVEEGTYISIYIKDVSRSQAELMMNSPVVFALLPYEQRISVINFVIRKHVSYDDPVKSKVYSLHLVPRDFHRLIRRCLYHL
jgi:pre-rRNA-processing protein TSR1